MAYRFFSKDDDNKVALTSAWKATGKCLIWSDLMPHKNKSFIDIIVSQKFFKE